MKESSAQDYALLVRGVSLSEHCWSVPISGSSLNTVFGLSGGGGGGQGGAPSRIVIFVSSGFFCFCGSLPP